MRRPLVGALFVFVAGVLAGLILPVPPVWPLTISCGAAIAATLCVHRPISLPVLWVAVLCLAWAHTAMEVRSPAPRDLGALMERPREHVQVRGLIADDPVEEIGPRGDVSVWRMTLRVEAVNRLGHYQKAAGLVDVHWRRSDATAIPAYGDRWEFTGVVQRREQADWRWAFLPPYRMRVDAAAAQRISHGHGSLLKRFSYAGRRAASERLGRGLDSHPDTAGILRALLLGYRHELPADHHRLFALTGTLHIFAISGLHVGIVAALLLVGVRACGVSRTRWVLYLAPLLILYTVATGMRPSALRACAMALAFSSAFLFNRKPDAPSAWALAALLILVAAPAQLTSPGFIFSFVIVAGLIRLYPLMAGPAREWWSADPYALTTPDGDESALRRGGRWFVGLAAASVAAWLSSAPLTAHYFNLFSPVGLIGNLFVIPAAFLLVLSGFLALVFGLAADVGAEIFNHANRMILVVLIALIDSLSQWPGGHWHVRSPGAGWMALWYAFIFVGLMPATRRRRQLGYAALVLLAVGGLAVQQADQSSRIHVLNVGDGHAALIRSGGEHILFDAGPAYRSEKLIRALRAIGVNRLEALILSHPSAAHAGGAEAVLRAMPVRAVWCTDFPSRSPAYDQALDVARELGIPISRLRAGDQGVGARGLAWEVLHPADPSAYRRAADASLVLRVSRGASGVLLMGGGGGAVEQAVLHARRNPAASVLVIGNQGRDGAASTEWLRAVCPEAVVLSVGAYNRYGYPEDDVLERLGQDEDLRLWRTDESGDVEVVLTSRVRFGRRVDDVRIIGAWAVEE